MIKFDKTQILAEAKDYLLITLGLTLYVFAWNAFLLPIQLTGGGITGIGAIIYYYSGFPVSATYAIINGVLLLIALKTVGWKFMIRTIYGVAVITLGFVLMPQFPPNTFIQSSEIFMSCTLGAICMGFGTGVVFIANGSSGGTDIIAKIVNTYRNVTMGRMLLYCDVIIISSSYLVFHNLEKIVYGLVVMAIFSFTVDLVVNGFRQSVQFFIFSHKYEEIANRINSDVRRGVTILDGMGWYSKEPIKVVTVLARKNESVKIFRLVKEIDPQAFVSQTSAIGVYGEGFDVMKSK